MDQRFWTSIPPKVVRNPHAFNMLTWKCASLHNGMHFFDIYPSKNGPYPSCFQHLDLIMRLAPQRSAIFPHLNFQKVATWCVLYILTWRCASRQLFISHLARWLHTRRFSEPTFRPSRPTNWKNTFTITSCTCGFFLLTLSLSLLYSFLLCFISPH